MTRYCWVQIDISHHKNEYHRYTLLGLPNLIEKLAVFSRDSPLLF